MKLFLLITVIFLLTGCQARENTVLPSARIVPFVIGNTILGYGVRIDSWNILTATHVVEDCRKWNCTFSWETLSGTYTNSRADASIIGKIQPTLDFKKQSVQKDDQVYLLRFLSGGVRRFDTMITAVDVAYIGFDRSMSWVYSTGWIEIGLSLEKGESGLPVWSLSGELIGVVSATNTVAGKSYVVQ